MINIGDVNIGNEIILNSFQSQVYSETLKKLEQFGIAGYDIDHESYIIQKTLAKHIAETISSEEETISEIPRLSQVAFKTLTNPDLYDSDIVNEELIQWVDVGNPYSFFLMKGELTDLSGNANDMVFPKSRVTTNGFRRNGTVINREIPALDFNGKGSRLNASSVIDDLFEPDGETSNGLLEGSIEMWVNLRSKKNKSKGGPIHTLFHFHVTGTPFGLHAEVYPNGELQIHKFSADTDEMGQLAKTITYSYSEADVIPIESWAHIAIVFTKDGVICYVNTKGYKLFDGKQKSEFGDAIKMNNWSIGELRPAGEGPVRGFTDGFGNLKTLEGPVALTPDAAWISAKRTAKGSFIKNLVGEFSSLRIYEKALDNSEVIQNFDASKGQYT